MHLEQTAHALFLAWTGVVNVCTWSHLTWINAEEHQTTNIRVGSNLEREGRGGRILRGNTVFLLTCCGVSTDDVGSIHWRRQEGTNIVEQCLYTLVLERRTTQHRSALHSQCTLADGCNDFLFGDRVGIFEIFLHESLVKFSGRLEKFSSPLFSLILEVGRDIVDFKLSTLSLIMPNDGLHLDQVNETLESLFAADRDNERHGVGTENILHLGQHVKVVGTRAVHLVHITQTRYIVFVSLTPYGLRLGLNTTNGAICSHSAVEYAQRALYLSGKVNVSRGVDQVDLELFVVIVPVACSCSWCDGDTTLLLLSHPVHRCTTFVHLTNLVGLSGVEQNTLRCRCLTGIDVGHNTDITGQM